MFSDDTRPDIVIYTNPCVEITKNDQSVISIGGTACKVALRQL